VTPSHAAETRAQALEQLTEGIVDLLVIGGGIIGSRVAYEATRAGLRVALVDAGDFGGGTSAASSKLIHGGLRYLATGDLRLVRELQRERDVLSTRVAPHLVRPLPLVLLVEGVRSRQVLKLAAALSLYSAISGFRRPRPRLIQAGRAAQLVQIQPGSSYTCGLIHEAVTHDARLALATVRAASRAEAIALNHVRAVAIHQTQGRFEVLLEDELTKALLAARCRAVVNAAGPWVDSVRRLENPSAPPLIRLSKGVHVVLPLAAEWHAGVALFDDSRSAIAIPWQGMLVIGATDTPFEGGASRVVPAPADIEMVLGWFRGVLSSEQLRPDRVLSSFAGLRALPPGRVETARASRKHLIDVGRDGMVSIAGGKLTNHRVIALDALRRLPGELRPRRFALSDAALPGGDLPQVASELERHVDRETAWHLLNLYGEEARVLLSYADTSTNALDRIHADGPDVWAQAHFAVDSEWAVTVDDLASRRTTLAVRGLATERIRAELAALLLQGRLAATESLVAYSALG
jgi:glycerol-3-phosphate dehydrogenase